MDYKTISAEIDAKFEAASSKIIQCSEMIQKFTDEFYDIIKIFGEIKDIQSKLMENHSCLVEDYRNQNHELVRTLLASIKFHKTDNIVKLDKELG